MTLPKISAPISIASLELPHYNKAVVSLSVNQQTTDHCFGIWKMTHGMLYLISSC